MRSIAPATLLLVFAVGTLGCRGLQYGHLVRPDKQDMVGSHAAGSEVYRPLIEGAVADLLTTCEAQPVAGLDGSIVPAQVCFVGVENCSSEELGDFHEHLYEMIDTRVSQAPTFAPISRRAVDAALQATRLRPDSLLVPDNMQLFTSVLGRQGQPVDYLLFAKLTTGTTERNASSQRDYLLTLEMVDTRTSTSHKSQAEIRKGYHRSPLGRFASYNFLPGNK